MMKNQCQSTTHAVFAVISWLWVVEEFPCYSQMETMESVTALTVSPRMERIDLLYFHNFSQAAHMSLLLVLPRISGRRLQHATRRQALPAVEVRIIYLGKIFPSQPATITQSMLTLSPGFSQNFIRPQHQNSTVTQYLTSQNPNISSLYNKNGRAYPDISAQESTIIAIHNGEISLQSETAASTAITAAVFALISDVRHRN